ncbi:hypothetical protein AAHK20_30110 [Trinickia sp. YCB016]
MRSVALRYRQAMRWFLVAIGATCVVTVAGCVTRPLPPYQPSIANQQSLSKLPRGSVYRVDVGDNPATVSNQVRAYSITAPNGGSWATYLSEGLRNELITAGNYDANAASTIKASLLTVQLADGHADVAARFVVERNGAVQYEKVLYGHGRWRTSMVGGIAIPAAYRGAGAVFQDLVSQFFNDPEFVKIGS